MALIGAKFGGCGNMRESAAATIIPEKSVKRALFMVHVGV
jgi:hypothetical protein